MEQKNIAVREVDLPSSIREFCLEKAVKMCDSVNYDYRERRSGVHAKAFLMEWKGSIFVATDTPDTNQKPSFSQRVHYTGVNDGFLNCILELIVSQLHLYTILM